ncbi:hypothetical protein [Alkalimonas amylolytica]|uniref:Secreted protein n=1 Tax=Alkalimonas amylolytica TaxID=152573 RepID=A0A1H3ZYF2_ALKAM|nr:hypothetical protein [Alkalimonas amylolytica]SEA28685.1 hypothetical protein SAMN04488051_102417 [Alkalimonas amylolytica]
MKKLLVAAAMAALFSGTAVAQEQAGGSSAGALGNVNGEHIVAGAVGLAVAAAIISNSRGTTIDPILPPPPPPLSCQGDDEINDDGFCVGSTTIVTGTGANTFTQLVTFTYAPSAQ